MPAVLCVCPHCRSRLQLPATTASTLQCPRCQRRFAVPTVNPPVAVPPATGPGINIPLVAGVGIGTVLISAVIVCLLIVSRSPHPHSERVALNADTAPTAPPASVPEKAPIPPPQPAPAPSVPKEQAPPPPSKPGPKPDPLAGYVPPSKGDPPAPPLPELGDSTNKLPEELQEKIAKAVERGVKYLKAVVLNGDDPVLNRPGGFAFAGLSLLSCGVPPEDAAVQQALARIQGKEQSLKSTYDLSLIILFLDRLGDRRGLLLLRGCALRLMAGQTDAGGWGYDCPALSVQQMDVLETALKSLAPSEKKAPDKNDSAVAPVSHFAVIRVDPQKIDVRKGGGDQSNTQFATMALWVARKYGVPVDRSLALVEARSRLAQNDDGSWGYQLMSRQWPDSMTCAGLLGLAVGRGIANKEDGEEVSGKDRNIDRGLSFLARGIGRPALNGKPNSSGGSGRLVGANAHGDLYYLWSLERVAVAYNLRTIGGKDWYRWGAELLVPAQTDDGSWKDSHAGVADTCFALLFLKRANVAQDLTAKLRTFNLIDLKDLDQTELRVPGTEPSRKK